MGPTNCRQWPRWMLLVILAGAVGAYSAPARAGSNTTTLQVSATVVGTCIVRATDVNFGAYTGQELRASGSVSARCNGTVGYRIALDAGRHYDGLWRAVSNGTQRIPYSLHAPNGHEWGDFGDAATYIWGFSVAGTGTGDWQTIPVAGVLFRGVTAIPAGMYDDVVTATIHF